jgi:AraC-like DNA-binding protein
VRIAPPLERTAADNDAVARYLGFHDAANFRRSFKRWTGSSPAPLRAALRLAW